MVRLIRTFSTVEVRDVRKFLVSPFFNQRDDLVQLFDWIIRDEDLKKEAFWQQLNADLPFEEQKLRLLMSYLHGLLEQYIAIKELNGNPLQVQLQLAIGYRKRGLGDALERVRKNLEKALEAQPLRNTFYHETRYQLQWEVHQLAYPQDPTNLNGLQALSTSADVLYLAQKLRLICLIAAHQSVYPSSAQGSPDPEEALIRVAERPDLAALPAIATYLHCYRMLRHPTEETHFQQLKNLLLDPAGHFSAEEMHGLYILAINYCVRQINAGLTRYFGEALDLYKVGLAKNYLLENGVLTRFTYHNVVASGIQTGELDWVRYFINEYKNRLEKRYRESSFSYNLARLEYARHNHSFVLELLQKANYRDPLLNLAAKTLLLKTYYALGEYDLLQSHLDAMRNYIHRKRVIGYHRTNYLNTIRYTEKLIRLNTWDKKAAEELREAIDREEVLTEKSFFQKVLHVTQ